MDGAIGAHVQAVQMSYSDFKKLSKRIIDLISGSNPAEPPPSKNSRSSSKTSPLPISGLFQPHCCNVLFFKPSFHLFFERGGMGQQLSYDIPRVFDPWPTARAEFFLNSIDKT
jgi:hypothetical protein